MPLMQETRTKAERAHAQMLRPEDRHLDDIVWRMNNLYFIKPKKGSPRLLKMKPAQRDMLQALIDGRKRLILPKAQNTNEKLM